MNNSDLLKDLLTRVEEGRADSSVYNTIKELIDADQSGELVQDLHRFHIAGLGEKKEPYDFLYWQSVLNEILESDKIKSKQPGRLVQMIRPKWWVAAASILIVFFCSYFLIFRNAKQASITKIEPVQDVLPGNNKAVLTLGNGSKIFLDSAQNGSLTQQGNTDVVKADSGKLTYRTNNLITKEAVYNTLSTPRGGQFQLALPDGTRVWLNAASSITFPTTFTGNSRKVSMTGEVYFEVVHDSKKPFSVIVNGAEIKDIGTHFNINAYPDEEGIKTSLLQGSVKITLIKNNQSVILSPGEQADAYHDQLALVKNINLDEVMAWKEGSFHFESADLKTILRQFSRWYDVDIVYEDNVPNEKYFVIISRSRTLGSVLNALRGGNIKFSIENKKLIVKPN